MILCRINVEMTTKLKIDIKLRYLKNKGAMDF